METRFLIVISIVLALFVPSYAFNPVILHSFRRKSPSLKMVSDALVVGLAGGTAESLSLRLKDLGLKTTVILDRGPYSPILQGKSKDIAIFAGDVSTSLRQVDAPSKISTVSDLAANKIIVLCGDDGDETIRGPIDKVSKSPSEMLVEATLKQLPPSSELVIVAGSVSSNQDSLSRLLGAKSIIEFSQDWSRQTARPLSLVRYPRLSGGIRGLEALPFVGLPLLEPEIHPSYSMKSVVLNEPSSKKYTENDLLTRDALTETLAEIVTKRIKGLDILATSVAGPSPTEKDWSRLFNRFASNSDAELVRLEFGSIQRPELFLQWIVDTWFPQAIIEAEAATLLSGARPVRAVKTSSTTAEIKWDDIKADLSVQQAGSLLITLVPSGDIPYLSVTRRSERPLPTDVQLTDKLVEGINLIAYKKGFCTPVSNVSN